MLFQLSYRPKVGGLRSDLNRYLSNSQLDALPVKLRTHLTGAVGLVACFREAVPTTFEVEARHSIQLSYTPVLFVNKAGARVARNRFFAKYFAVVCRLYEKPGFFDLRANIKVHHFDTSGELQLFKKRRTITLCFPRIATKI